MLENKFEIFSQKNKNGGVAQMVERSLSMREVPGSIPGASKSFSMIYAIMHAFLRNFTFKGRNNL